MTPCPASDAQEVGHDQSMKVWTLQACSNHKVLCTITVRSSCGFSWVPGSITCWSFNQKPHLPRQECLQLWLCALLIETFTSLPSMNPKRLFKLKFRGTTKQACLPQSWGRKQGWHSFFFGLLRGSVVTAYWLFWPQCSVWFVQQ